MPFYWRKSKKIGPFNLTGSKSGLTLSAGSKNLRQSASTSGRRSTTWRFFGWMKRKSGG
jgi:hypothetical protein